MFSFLRRRASSVMCSSVIDLNVFNLCNMRNEVEINVAKHGTFIMEIVSIDLDLWGLMWSEQIDFKQKKMALHVCIVLKLFFGYILQ